MSLLAVAARKKNTDNRRNKMKIRFLFGLKCMVFWFILMGYFSFKRLGDVVSLNIIIQKSKQLNKHQAKYAQNHLFTLNTYPPQEVSPNIPISIIYIKHANFLHFVNCLFLPAGSQNKGRNNLSVLSEGIQTISKVGVGGRQEMAFLMAQNYNPIKKMHSFIQNLCVPSEPTLKPIAHAQNIDQFSLQTGIFTLEEEGPVAWSLEERASEWSQQQTMEMEQQAFSMKRRHCCIVDGHSRRPMFSKLQRMDRAPIKRRHC